jgi:hypothetical protein
MNENGRSTNRAVGEAWVENGRRGPTDGTGSNVSHLRLPLSAVRVGIDPKLMGQKVYSVARRWWGGD